MHRRRRGTGTHLVADGDARGAIVDANLHLDQLVRGQGAIDFGDQAVGHACADVYHRFERVAAGLQMGSLARSEFGHPAILALPRYAPASLAPSSSFGSLP